MTHKPNSNKKKDIADQQHEGTHTSLKMHVGKHPPFLSSARFQSIRAKDSCQEQSSLRPHNHIQHRGRDKMR